MNYQDVVDNVSQQLAASPSTVSAVTAAQPQEETDTLMNNIGLAINREGGMNI